MCKLTKYQKDTLRRAGKILENQIRDNEHGAFTDPNKVKEYLKMRLAFQEQEVFAIMFLDNRHRLIAFEELFKGTIDAAAVYPREVFKAAFAHNAAAMILAHNHPSGTAEPSDADVRLTGKLVKGAALLDLRILDHIIVGNPHCTSLAERGLM